jgi:hypothetical protein
MVAPHFSACLLMQSGFELPAGAVLDAIVSDFPQNLACGVEHGRTRAAANPRRCGIWTN